MSQYHWNEKLDSAKLWGRYGGVIEISFEIIVMQIVLLISGGVSFYACYIDLLKRLQDT